MLRYPKPRLVFIFAITLLMLSGIAAGVTVYRLYESERWVRHTFETELTIGAIETDLSRAARARLSFINGDPQGLVDFSEAHDAAFTDLNRVRSLTWDNKQQLDRCDRLQSAIEGRLGLLQKSIDLAKSPSSDERSQDQLTADLVDWNYQTAAITEDMKEAEENLLSRRNQITSELFRLIVGILLFTFLTSIYLIWEHYRRLTGELRQRTLAERNAQQLSLHLLRAQDEERRKISRDLHDGLGQNLTAAKMIAESIPSSGSSAATRTELLAILDDVLKSVRTMSYLLHPPMLDEIGLASAAEWFIEGFAKRSGMDVVCRITGDKRRLPPTAELTLFRVLQESMTNIQRHAQSPSAEVHIEFAGDRVIMSVRDHGVGMSGEKLKRFTVDGTQAGVGLPGMRQRIQEQNGTFVISSNLRGTTISVELPVTPMT
jgi:signal transduction histidine kinase